MLMLTTAVGCTGVASTGAEVQSISPPEASVQALKRAKSLKCTFGTVASADMDNDKPDVKIDRQTFGFQIDGID